MSFSSLLPAPKHRDLGPQDGYEKGRIIVKALTDADDEADAPNANSSSGSDTLEKTFRDVASRVQLQDFIPLRQRNFNLSIPYPSEEEMNKTYTRTFNHFQKLLAKSKKNHVDDDPNEIAIMANGRKIHVVTRSQDPLQPKMSKRAKKVYVPSNEEETVQPQLHISSNFAGQQVSKEMKKDWEIPKFVSQWKNPKGYVIQSRGAKTGGSSQEINEGFVDLANALEQADKEARLRLQLKKEAKVIELNRAMREREEKLNQIAQEVRQNRSYLRGSEGKRSLRQRDISEKVDMYQNDGRYSKKHKGNNYSNNTVSYDSRLYTKGVMNAKQRAENVYDNPLFAQQDIDSIYRVKYNKNKDSDDEGENVMSNGPVEFTKAERK